MDRDRTEGNDLGLNSQGRRTQGEAVTAKRHGGAATSGHRPGSVRGFFFILLL